MSQSSKISQRALLLAAASTLGLIAAIPAQAQAPAVPGPRTETEFTPGKRVDRSRTLRHPVAPNVEREGVEFDSLGPSALTRDEQAVVAQPAPAPVVELRELLDGTNFESGRDVLLPKARQTLDALAARLRGQSDLRFEIVGHTDNQRISQRLKAVFPDNQALSEARARAVAAYLAGQLGLPMDAFAVVGRGETQPVATNDTPQGMAQNRRTEIRVSYRQVSEAPQPAPAPVVSLVKQDYCAPGVSARQPVSISFDGAPVEGDTSQVEADRQRCVDVALERADIQVKYDPFNLAPALNVWAVPGEAGRGREVLLRTYTNYAWWLKTAEIRIFAQGQSVGEMPLATVPVEIGGEARWTPPANASHTLAYVLRVYDDKGRFDETAPKPLLVEDRIALTAEAERSARDDMSGYGQSSLKLHNIPARGGAVTISGEKIAPGQTVTALGMAAPVDPNGKFVVRQILPAGAQKVVVSVKGADGEALTFERNLSIAADDWFYVAMADLTASKGRTTGPAQMVAAAPDDRYVKETTIDGRLAFYLKGKILGKYLLTASADTQERPLKDLFSNFDSKDPTYLLRRIDPNRYYPVYGDDSTIVDDAPTQGKFFVRLERDASSVMWGNFQTSWTGTELTQYSRGLYGGDLIWKSEAQTSFGERRTTLEAFAAEPGTLQSREEFRGSSGSLFYLRRHDITQGSERVWVEIRDKDSGMVLERTLLAPSQDYEINYLQGRLTLRSPLPSVADGLGLVQTSTLNGNPVYLVATYEYAPGLSKVEGSTVGARASHWLNDYLRVGGTYYREGDGLSDQTLTGGDFTLRYRAGTWLKGEYARSKGMGDGDLTSLNGGFDFTQNLTSSSTAEAYRFDMAVNLADLNEGLAGRITAYVQDRGRGFSGPGLVTPNGEAVRQQGFAAVVPVADRAEIAIKVDDREALSQSAEAQEAAVRVKLNAEWGVSAGLRRDDRSAPPGGGLYNASPTLSRYGERTDAILRVDFRPLAPGQDADGPIATGVADASSTYGAPGGNGLVTADANGPAGSLLPSAIDGSGGVVQTSTDPTLAAGVAAARVAGLEYRDWSAYGFVQQTLSRSGARPNNNRAGVGGDWQVTDRIRIGAEASGGSGGVGGRLSGEYRLDERSNLYLTYAQETEVPDQTYAGRQGVLTFGGRMRLTDQLGVFAETRAASSEGPHSLTNGFGVDFTPAERWTTGVRFETGRLSDPISGDMKRNAVSLNAGYKSDRLKLLSAIEYRRDKTSTLGLVQGTCPDTPDAGGLCVPAGTMNIVAGDSTRETILFKNSASYQLDLDWRLLGVFNLSRSTSSDGAFYDGDYTEAVVGAAYRPVDNDRWNTLFKYTYFYNLPSTGQVDNFTNSLFDYSQRSHVLNFDTIYDLRPWLSVGAKYGVRVGELKSRTGGDWLGSRAQLVVLRTDLHLVKEWDAVAEWRRLSVQEADDSRTGFLLGAYRHIGEHGKLGVGYNFTDFSDDLTDLSYRHRGFFINALAAF